ncbi:MAG: hypothetical protein KDC38_11070, partial [Planctomycetes bacterium]|nr:hypothetical protein [Planctomycetota bacterium]
MPELGPPGDYLVELIGKGQACRALVRKGRLEYREEPGPAGHVFEVFDEDGRRIVDAALEFGPHRFAADDEGRIVVPYTTDPGERSFVLTRAYAADGRSIARTGTFEHRSESYELDVSIACDLEAAVVGETAPVEIGCELTLFGQPLPLDLIED